MKKAVQFGAGNIGRGFIGALLSKAGYHVVFADVSEDVVNRINKDGHYTIHVKDIDSEEIKIDNISAVNSTKDDAVNFIEDAEIITTAVGPLNLDKIAPLISKVITNRFEKNSKEFLNIIACENAVYASSKLKDYVYSHLNDEQKEYANTYVGFPNCSVDRIVPPSNNENPLDVTVEKFYEWNVEKDGFNGPMPEIEGMNLADNLLAYIERKLFTLNTGHAITAYLGKLLSLDTVDKAIQDDRVYQIVYRAMRESGDALIEKFNFDKNSHYVYIDKIIERFKNPHLKDDVDRVGREPIRKLSKQERLVKPLETALSYNLPADNLIKGIGAALHFDGGDPQSKELKEMIDNKGVKETLKEISGIEDNKVLDQVVEEFKNFA